MQTSTAARRYARALFGLAKEAGRTREVLDEVVALNELMDANKPLRDALLTPLRPARERHAVHDAVCERASISPLVRTFFSFLIDQRRLIQHDAIVDAYQDLFDEDSGLLTAEVRTASELDERRRDRLRRALSERTGKEVKLDVQVDPSLIGGAIAKVGGLVFDGSIRTQLDRLQDSLTKGS